MSRIILASASPRRQELLRQIGLEFQILPSRFEEKTKDSAPSEMVMALAKGKAADVYDSLPEQEKQAEDLLVIGADTIVVYEGQVMGKPKDPEHAVEMLGKLQGNTHQVYTGVALIWQGEDGNPVIRSFYEETHVTMYPMTREEIEDYAATGEPMDKAGAYGIQGRCAAYIREIKGDYNNVVGLPVGRLYQEIKKLKDERL